VTKTDREIMEILEAFDLTRCPHSAAELAGCDPKRGFRFVGSDGSERFLSFAEVAIEARRRGANVLTARQLLGVLGRRSGHTPGR